MIALAEATVQRPVERDVELARQAVLRHDPDALDRAQEVRDRLGRLCAHADLLAALAASDHGDRGRLAGAIAAMGTPADPEAMLDLALALLVDGRPAESVAIVREALRTGAAQSVTPTQLMAFIDQLLGARGHSELEPLLRVIYDRLVGADPAVPGRGTRGPRPKPAARRRFLKDSLRLIDERLEAAPHDGTLACVRAGALIGLGRLDEALDTVNAVLAREPENTLAQDLLVATLTRKRSYGTAVDELQKLPPERRNAPELVSTQVDLLVNLGAPDDAVRVAEEAVGPTADDADVRAAHVRALMAAGRHAEAVQHASRLAAEREDRVDLMVLLGEALRAAGDGEQAYATLRHATERDPSSVVAHAQLAAALEDRGEPGAALDELGRALEIDPGRADLALERSRLLLQAGRTVEALEFIDSMDVALLPEANELRGDILAELGRPDEALAAYLSALDGAGDARAIAGKVESQCDTLLNQGRHAAALDGLDALRARQLPLTPHGMALRAELLRLALRPRAAVEQARAAAAAGYRADWFTGTHADSLLAIGRPREALEMIEQALADFPDYVFGRSVLVYALLDLGLVTRALEELDAHFPPDAAPPNWNAWAIMARGGVLLHAGRFKEAVALLEDARIDLPGDADILATLGAGYARQRRLRPAIEALEESVRLRGEDASPWVLTTLADTLTARAGRRTPEATAHLELVTGRLEAQREREPLAPRARLDLAAALMQLDPRRAVGEFEAALAENEVALPDWELCLCAALVLAGEQPRADALFTDVLAGLRDFEDAARVRGVLAEGAFTFWLLERDHGWSRFHGELARLRERLEAA